MNIKPASEKQMYWIVKMLDQKILPHDLRVEIQQGLASGNISSKDAGRFLDVLFNKNTPNVQLPGTITEVGFYSYEGSVYRVVKGKQSGNLYAKKVTAHGFDFEAGKGMMKVLKADMKMTVEDICAFGLGSGVCCNCSTMLTDPISIFIGLGTTCGPNLMGKPAYNQARKNAKEDPTTAEALFHIEARKAEAAAEMAAV
jgi:hypothetical protein